MNLSSMDLNLLLVFEAVYSERNLTRASKRLNLTQPAVSNALRRLRDTFQDPLFIRTADGMVPTDLAEQLAGRVLDALEMLRSFESRESFDPAGLTRDFRISISDYNGMLVLPRLLKALAEQAPGVSITTSQIQRAHVSEHLSTGQVDLVLAPNQDVANLSYEPLYADDYVGVASAHCGPEGGQMSLEEYCQREHLLFSLEGYGRSTVDVALSKLGKKRKVVLRSSHVHTIPHVLEGSAFIATLPRLITLDYLKRFELTSFGLPVELKGHEVGLHWHARQHHDPAHEWLRGLIKELFAH